MAITTLTAILSLTTAWNSVLKALRTLRVPIVAVVLLGMTYRYIFLLLQTAQEMMWARKARLISPLQGREARHLMAASAGVLLSRTVAMSRDIHLAMQSRGYRGEVYLLEDFHWRGADTVFLGAGLILALALWVTGR